MIRRPPRSTLFPYTRSSDLDLPAVIVVPEAGPSVTVTFGELADRVARVAGGLAAMGVGRGDRVVVMLDQGVSALTTLLATLRLGAICVPIPPTFGTDAVAYRLGDRCLLSLVAGVAAPERGRVGKQCKALWSP